MCHKVTVNTHTLYPCQFPGFDIVFIQDVTIGANLFKGK